MGLHCGVDLHGSNGFYGVVDESGRRVLSKRLPASDPGRFEDGWRDCGAG